MVYVCVLDGRCYLSLDGCPSDPRVARATGAPARAALQDTDSTCAYAQYLLRPFLPVGEAPNREKRRSARLVIRQHGARAAPLMVRRSIEVVKAEATRCTHLRTATVEAVVSTLAMATGDQSSSVLAALARRDLLADALEVLRVEGSGRQGATNSNGSDEAGAG